MAIRFRALLQRWLPGALALVKRQNVEWGQDRWNELYKSGRWDYLGSLDELAHYSIIVGYIQHFAAEGRVLDVGCGDGVLARRLSHLPYTHYAGVDISPVAIDKAIQANLPRCRFVATDPAGFTPNGPCDAIVFNEALYCFNDCQKVLRHYEQFLSDSGVLIISMHEQEISLRYWKKIAALYRVLDDVSVSNSQNINWTIKAIGRWDAIRQPSY